MMLLPTPSAGPSVTSAPRGPWRQWPNQSGGPSGTPRRVSSKSGANTCECQWDQQVLVAPCHNGRRPTKKSDRLENMTPSALTTTEQGHGSLRTPHVCSGRCWGQTRCPRRQPQEKQFNRWRWVKPNLHKITRGHSLRKGSIVGEEVWPSADDLSDRPEVRAHIWRGEAAPQARYYGT